MLQEQEKKCITLIKMLFQMDNRNNINAKALLLKQILDDRCINSKRFDQICKKNSIDLNSDSITDGDKIDDISHQGLRGIRYFSSNI